MAEEERQGADDRGHLRHGDVGRRKQDKVVLRVDDERGVKLAFTTASVGRVLEASSESRRRPREVAVTSAAADRPSAEFIDIDRSHCLRGP